MKGNIAAMLGGAAILLFTIITGRADYVTQVALAAVVVVQALALLDWARRVRDGRVIIMPRDASGAVTARRRVPAPNGEDQL